MQKHLAILLVSLSALVSLSLPTLAGSPGAPSDKPTTDKSARGLSAATVSKTQIVRPSVPDKLVVLTFDDSAKSHFTIARPLLKEYGFGATFFITEGFDFRDNKTDYMTWQEIRQLHEEGFEIGNHTRDHLGITDKTLAQLPEQLEAIASRCRDNGIPSPVTFAWPGNATTPAAFEVMKQHGIIFARRGGAPEYPYEEGQGFAFEPGKDHPLLLPSAGDARPNWTLANFIRAAEQARNGRVAILQFHGVPDTAHNWVSSTSQNFEAYLKYLKLEDYKVIALRDLRHYVNPEVVPSDPLAVINARKAHLTSSE
ncbi:MAG: polysaccharide deacetylase family protein [Planctomycetaceae bacterium]|nr:polysaccharide deacetylase family protein [Planctomycetaceae bacterium]